MNKTAKPQSSQPTAEQLEQIGRYTRRALAPEEVYVFSLILCDNEIDRDFERFDEDALATLGELFVGKTGVFDHAPKAENQSARIFATEVMNEAGKKTSTGMEYLCLKAWAYMVRCEKNTDLILEIEAGIKKEVSVGCAVEQVLCSVCGANQKTAPCEHAKGKAYGGELCHHVLSCPTDAYEWSFVAVPAQKNAGVVKTHQAPPSWGALEESRDVMQKLYGPGPVRLTEKEAKKILAEAGRLAALAKAGEEYTQSLRRQVLKNMLLAQPELEPGAAADVVEGMGIPQLQAFEKAFAAGAAKRYPLPQLSGPCSKEENSGFASFKL